MLCIMIESALKDLQQNGRFVLIVVCSNYIMYIFLGLYIM